jgi:hypothetical protein
MNYAIKKKTKSYEKPLRVLEQNLKHYKTLFSLTLEQNLKHYFTVTIELKQRSTANGFIEKTANNGQWALGSCVHHSPVNSSCLESKQ